MSELTAKHAFDVYEEYTKTGDDEQAQVYLKSEADKVIAELEDKARHYPILVLIIEDAKRELARRVKEIRQQKYKRCLAMATLCYTRDCIMLERAHGTDTYYTDSFYWKRAKWYCKWKRRWMKLAEKFKDN